MRANEILANPFHWLLKAAAMGFFISAPVGFVIYYPSLPRTLTFGTIGAIFCVVMWAGGVFAGSWTFQDSPRLSPTRYALQAQLRWLLVYGALLGVAILLIRFLLGINLVQNPRDLAFTAMIGYLISSLVLGFRLTAMVAERSRELEAARSRATLLALQAQLSPHTLFNALNTVAALIPEDPKQAETVVEGLSRLLRRILDALEKETWTLEAEFGLIQDLVELEQARFGPRLQAVLRFDPTEAERPVPPLLLLPLVENCLKHGFRPKIGICRLEVRGENGRVVIQDDGVGRAADAKEGVGMRTVRQRLEAQGGRLRWLEVPQGTCLEVVW
jgi:signal transduction histidine kinase